MTNGEVNVSIAVDIVGREANIVIRRLRRGLHDVRLPARIFQPDESLTVDDRDVKFAIAAQVDRRHCVPDSQLNWQHVGAPG